MGYTDYLTDMLRPLRIYNLEEGMGAEELRMEGAFLDQLSAQLSHIAQEAFVQTAQTEGLLAYESLLPKGDTTRSQSLEERRKRIMTLLQLGVNLPTVGEVEGLLNCLGYTVQLTEHLAQEQVEVSFPETTGVPEYLLEIEQMISMLIPCHLEVSYKYETPSWEILESKYASWESLEDNRVIWEDLEK